MKHLLWFVLLTLAGCPSSDPPTNTPTTRDYAQYICDTLWDCFDIDAGKSCAQDLIDTTSVAHIRQCAVCYEESTCDEIGAPGVPGTCDDACADALFGQ